MRLSGAYFVHLRDDCIQNLAFERPKYDRLIFDWVDDEALSRLNNTRTNVIDGRHRNDKSIFAGARAFHLRVQLLSHRFHQLGPKVFRMQQNFVLQ